MTATRRKVMLYLSFDRQFEVTLLYQKSVCFISSCILCILRRNSRSRSEIAQESGSRCADLPENRLCEGNSSSDVYCLILFS